MEISTLILTGVDHGGLPTGYKSVGDGIVYDQAWDETAELLISDEVRKSEVEQSGIGGGKIKSSEVGEGQLQGIEVGESKAEGIEVEKSEVDNWERDDSDTGESETGENDTEESDHFEDCN